MKLKSLLTALAPVAVLFSSCLKSHNTTDLIEDNGSIVTVITDVGATGGEHVFSLDATPVIETLDLMTVKVYSSGNAKPNGPVHVKLAITNASGYFPMPASGYSIPLEFDIPSGTTEYKVPITIKKNMLDLSLSNGFQISIASVSQGVIGKNDKTMVFGFLIKNQWDGKYKLTWTNYHPTLNAGYTGDSTEIELHTSGSNSSKMYWPLAQAYCTPAILSGGFSYFGIQEPNYTVNTTTNAVTVQNVAAGAVTFYTMAAGYNSRYDPATKTFFVKWGYSYATPGVFDPGCREWTQKFTYLGPR